MLFNSTEFLFVFLPITFALFFLAARVGAGAAISVLGVASLAFYSYWDISFLPILATSIIVNFLFSRLISRYRPHGKPILVVAIIFNIAMLAVYKYADFLIGTVNAISHTDVPLLSLALPLGISFFTFTQIAFLVDTWRNEASEPSFSKYLLFVTYFPHLIAGPILHHKQMMPQFGHVETLHIRAESIAVGLALLTVGLFKKVVIADRFGEFATPVFAAGASGVPIGFAEAWAGALAYTLQLYFDFSAYSDMAIGLSRLFNIDLPVNFNSPYKSRNIIEFWRRWHISLSTFLRDYLYIPLGGNRSGKVRRYINLFLTMLLGGLWHGANWTFVVWGAIHGMLLIINHAFAGIRERISWLRMPGWLAMLLTFTAVVLAWVPFRAESFAAALNLWQAMFTLPSGDWSASASGIETERALRGILFGLLVVWLMPNSQEFVARFWRNGTDATAYVAPRRLAWAPTVGWGLVLGAIFAWVVMNFGKLSEFLYFQF
ncbi:MAG: MBOAT family O-acyltransferase [Pseudomonadota bacterium]